MANKKWNKKAVLWCLTGGGVTFCFVFLRLYYGGRFESEFTYLESGILIIVGGLSTVNYYFTSSSMKKAGKSLNLFYSHIVIIINVGLFCVSILLIEKAELFALVVYFIYYLFSRTNLNQLKVLLENEKDQKEHYEVFIESYLWLAEENGISTIAFTSVFAILFGLAFIHWWENDWFVHWDYFYTTVKAFIAGAATFHLTVSVIKYYHVLSRSDVVEESLDDLSVKIERLLSESQSQNVNLESGDIFKLGENLKSIITESVDFWKKMLVWTASLSVFFTIATYCINYYTHDEDLFKNQKLKLEKCEEQLNKCENNQKSTSLNSPK